MKRKVLLVLVACFLVAATGGGPVQGYNSAGHVYIAERALGTLNSNALYGAMAPDIIGYLPPDLATVLEPYHVYSNLVSKAVTVPEKMFALGWASHNGLWGADSFAHRDPAYVITKAGIIAGYLDGIPNAEGVGHIAAELAIDILLQQRDSLLAMKTYQAAAQRTGNVSMFLWQAGVLPDKKLANEADASFRKMTMEYALALGATTPTELTAMAQFASKMASDVYGMTITPEEAAQIIGVGLLVCKDDYIDTVDAAIAEIRQHVLAGDF